MKGPDGKNMTAPRSPNFNELGADHFDLLSTHPPLTPALIGDVDHIMRQRWGVLLSIDDLVAGLHQAVEDAGIMDSTFFLYSSDHGYHLGQFRIPIEKMLPYETDIRIPLFIKGPGIAAGTKLDLPVMNIDISPTLLDLAGIPVPPIMDGQSLVPMLTGKPKPAGWRTRFASEFAEGGIQHYGPFVGAAGLYDNPDNQWRMLRVMNETHDFSYTEWDREYIFNNIQFREYYNTKVDPWQRKNLWNSTAADIQGSLHAELVNMFTCTGTRTTVSNCHARSASPLLPPAPAPPPAPPGPPPRPPPPPYRNKCSLEKGEVGVVLNDTDIDGGDIVSPCSLVAFPGTHAGATQCMASCAANAKCKAWTFHLKEGEKQWRCCVKDSLHPWADCRTARGMWSGVKGLKDAPVVSWRGVN